ncbi:MAG: hypothetical protein ACPGZU_04675 [Ketobacter sp.]|uniref:hypothetical protein n=1 Tax=unclassified Ketobacter TaxID=2639109 RepID=UPI0025BEE5B3|nr:MULTISPECIES: hypothetical protein [unclassified Ketobacter]
MPLLLAFFYKCCPGAGARINVLLPHTNAYKGMNMSKGLKGLAVKALLMFSVVLVSACGAKDAGLNLTIIGEGSVTSPSGVDCSESCAATVKLSPPTIGNKLVEITATPAPGYTFLGWNNQYCTPDDVCDLKYTGLCADQLLCLTGFIYSGQRVEAVFVDSSLLVDSGWSELAVCAILGDGEVRCWSASQDEVEQVPALNNPQQVAVSDYAACALVDEGISCWGKPNFLPEDGPTVYPPLEMEMLRGEICVLDQEGVKCWSAYGPPEIPEFVNPTNLRKRSVETPEFIGKEFCVDDEGAEVCW